MIYSAGRSPTSLRLRLSLTKVSLKGYFYLNSFFFCCSVFFRQAIIVEEHFSYMSRYFNRVIHFSALLFALFSRSRHSKGACSAVVRGALRCTRNRSQRTPVQSRSLGICKLVPDLPACKDSRTDFIHRQAGRQFHSML